MNMFYVYDIRSEHATGAIYAAKDNSLLEQEVRAMKHIKTLNTRNLKESMKTGGCGECQTSCQSACKTSCTVGNQSCENK